MTYLPKLHTAAEDREYFSAQLRQKDCLLAFSAERLAAFAILGDGWVHHLYVDPSHQGRGIGTLLLLAAKSRNEAGLQLWTFQPNAGARRFYERHGFVPVEETDGAGVEEHVADVRYEWRGGGAPREAPGARPGVHP
jgi:GNAT superfamily N-acetyltransferase